MCLPAVTYRSGLMYWLYAMLIHRPMALIVSVGTPGGCSNLEAVGVVACSLEQVLQMEADRLVVRWRPSLSRRSGAMLLC